MKYTGRSFMVQRFVKSSSNIFEGRWCTTVLSDLKAPTYEGEITE
jgi:hypothetical protein